MTNKDKMSSDIRREQSPIIGRSDDVPPHHCAPSDYLAMIVHLQRIEAGELSPANIDWRTQAGVLWRMLHYATRATDAGVDAFLAQWELGRALSHVLEFIPTEATCNECVAAKKLAYECNSKIAKALEQHQHVIGATTDRGSNDPKVAQ